MRAAYLYAVGLSVVGIAVACGSDTSKDDGEATQQQPFDGGSSGKDAGPAEQKLTTFTCGGTSCVVGEHACCQLAGSFGCFSLEAGGCPVLDAGVDADAGLPPPPLLCATYNNCPGEKGKCCFSADAGSNCIDSDSCPNGQVNLCTLSVDGCGESYDCDPFAASPLPEAGTCVKHD
jgi:hypothetical protein